jgi:hypothetical protein
VKSTSRANDLHDFCPKFASGAGIFLINAKANEQLLIAQYIFGRKGVCLEHFTCFSFSGYRGRVGSEYGLRINGSEHVTGVNGRFFVFFIPSYTLHGGKKKLT